jgi:arylsulfatase A-like enzyme
MKTLRQKLFIHGQRWRPALTTATLIVLAVVFLPKSQPAHAKPNVLFIAVDDLNHWLRHLGRNKQVITPNIDRLASHGMSFTKAYCAAPICDPPGTASLSEPRPSTTGVYDNSLDWRPHMSRDLALITDFRHHSHYTAAAGEIYHGRFDRQEEWDDYGKERGGK